MKKELFLITWRRWEGRDPFWLRGRQEKDSADTLYSVYLFFRINLLNQH